MKKVGMIINLLMVAYGACAFAKRGIGDYLLMKGMFAFFELDESRLRVLLDYALVMVLVAGIAYWMHKGLLKAGNGKKLSSLIVVWLKGIYHKAFPIILNSVLCRPAFFLEKCVGATRAALLGKPHISAEDVRNVEENVTFVFKSFNRQDQAKQLYRCIKAYYPNAAIIIADDSRKPLDLPGVVRLPFNSGLSKGLIAALERVQTPYVMRMDDDELLTPASNVHLQLKYLQTHAQVDLVGIQPTKKARESAAGYGKVVMNKSLLIPAGTVIDGKTTVYKPPNVFVARTDKVRMVGYDPNIRMLDHHEFFYRAAGVIVCVQDEEAYVLHLHYRFNRDYLPYRKDFEGDKRYIRAKHNAYRR